MKKIIVWGFFVLALLVVVPPAEAQFGRVRIPRSLEEFWYAFTGDQVMLVTSQNLALIDRLDGRWRREQFRSFARDAFQAPNGFWGVYGPDGRFVRVAERDGRMVSDGVRQPRRFSAGQAAGDAVSTAAIVGGVSGNWRVAAAAGGGVFLLERIVSAVRGGGDRDDRRESADRMPMAPSGQTVWVDTRYPPAGYAGQQGQQWSMPAETSPVPNQAVVPSGPVPESAGSESEDDTPMFSISNSTEYYMELYDQEGTVFDRNQFLAFVKPGECVSFPAPVWGFKGFFLVPTDGGIKKVLAVVEDEPTGMVFSMPQGGGGV